MIILYHPGRIIAEASENVHVLMRCAIGEAEIPHKIAKMLGEQKPHRHRTNQPEDDLPQSSIELSRPLPSLAPPPLHQPHKQQDIGNMDQVVRG